MSVEKESERTKSKKSSWEITKLKNLFKCTTCAERKSLLKQSRLPLCIAIESWFKLAEAAAVGSYQMLDDPPLPLSWKQSIEYMYGHILGREDQTQCVSRRLTPQFPTIGLSLHLSFYEEWRPFLPLLQGHANFSFQPSNKPYNLINPLRAIHTWIRRTRRIRLHRHGWFSICQVWQ